MGDCGAESSRPLDPLSRSGKIKSLIDRIGSSFPTIEGAVGVAGNQKEASIEWEVEDMEGVEEMDAAVGFAGVPPSSL